MRFPLIQIITIIFVVAKIVGYLDWSWWAVFSPIWLYFILCWLLGFISGVIEQWDT
jgi:hypothetical protein